MFVCNASCQCCYLKDMPPKILSKLYYDVEKDYNNFVKGLKGLSYANEVEISSLMHDGKVYGDVTAVPLQVVERLAKRVEDGDGCEVWFTTSNIEKSGVNYLIRLKKSGLKLRLKLAIHGLNNYMQYRGKNQENVERLKDNIRRITNAADRTVAMQVLFPSYIGWEDIKQTGQWLLAETNISALCWYTPCYNKWMKKKESCLTFSKTLRLSIREMEEFGKNRFRSPFQTFICGMKEVNKRIEKIPEGSLLLTSETMLSYIKNKLEERNIKAVAVRNDFFRVRPIEGIGFATVYDMEKIDDYKKAKTIVLPKETSILHGQGKDTLGNKIDKEILYI